MKNSKLQSFTLLEITVTMIISALLIGLTFTIYNLVSGSYNSFSTKNDKVIVLLTLDKLLKRDFSNAEKIWREGNNIFIANQQDTALYKFELGLLVREIGKVDTFDIDYRDLITKFEGKIAERTEQTQLQDEVSFIVTYGDQSIPYHFYKRYSSDNLFNP